MNYSTTITNGTIATICHQCGLGCGIKVHIENNTLQKISGNSQHPENRGRLCPKGLATLETIFHRERLLHPLKKQEDGSFQEIPLDQALDEIAQKMQTLQSTYGSRSIGFWHGEGVGFEQQEEYVRRFSHAFGSPNYFSCNSACFVSRTIAYSLVQGYVTGHPDFQNAGTIILWGSNPASSHSVFMPEINAAQKNGAKLIVIDPRLTAIAKKADLFLPITPGTDGALVWALNKLIIEDKAYDHDFVQHYSEGFDDFAAYSRSFTLEYVSRETGLDRDDILELYRSIKMNRPRVVNYVGVSLEHQENGVNTMRAISSLSGLCGAVDVKGGDTWPEPFNKRSLRLNREKPLLDQHPIGKKEFPALYDYGQECHTMTGMEYMLGRGEYPLRALILTAGNPAVTNPNTKKVKEALSSLDLLVVKDMFFTDTARLADYVLPAGSYLERSELYTYPHRQHIALARKIMEIPGIQNEYRFWRSLAQRLGFAETYFPWKDETELIDWYLEPSGITRQMLEEESGGKTFKPFTYQKYRDRPFATPSGKFEFVSRYCKEKGYETIPKYHPPFYSDKLNSTYPFLLITGARKLIFSHSRFRNISNFRKKYPGAQLELHPRDAEKLGISNGDAVKVVSENGETNVHAHVLSAGEIVQGVVQITHGWSGKENVNNLTYDLINDPLSGFPLLTSVPVRITPLFSEKKS